MDGWVGGVSYGLTTTCGPDPCAPLASKLDSPIHAYTHNDDDARQPHEGVFIPSTGSLFIPGFDPQAGAYVFASLFAYLCGDVGKLSRYLRFYLRVWVIEKPDRGPRIDRVAPSLFAYLCRLLLTPHHTTPRKLDPPRTHRDGGPGDIFLLRRERPRGERAAPCDGQAGL
jgi:hypothetical protein